VVARLTVDGRHLQPFGIVHGGVYAAIAEAIASIGAGMNPHARVPGSSVVGLDNHTSFLRATRAGAVILAEAIPRQAGRRTQSWDVSMRDAEGREVAISRVRLLVQPLADLPHGPVG